MAYATGLKPVAFGHEGSSPSLSTNAYVKAENMKKKNGKQSKKPKPTYEEWLLNFYKSRKPYPRALYYHASKDGIATPRGPYEKKGMALRALKSLDEQFPSMAPHHVVTYIKADD